MFTFSKTLTTIFKCRTALIECKYSTELPIRTLLNNSEKMSKAIIGCKCKRMIKFAAREKGQFLEFNPKLTYWVEEAKKYGVSENAIDFAINLTTHRGAKMGIHEIAFQGKSMILAQYETVDLSNLNHKIMKTCSEFDATLLQTASHSHMYYNPEAVIVVVGKDGNNLLDNSDKEKISSIGDLLRIGDLRIAEEADHTGKKNNIIVRCDVSRLHQVKRELINRDYTVEEAFVGFAPKVLAKLPIKIVERVSDLILMLSEMEEIERLYENVE